MGAPWSSGAWGPGPNGPVVDPILRMDNREPLSRTDSGMKRDKAASIHFAKEGENGQ